VVIVYNFGGVKWLNLMIAAHFGFGTEGAQAPLGLENHELERLF
jgi:hypothetical protein